MQNLNDIKLANSILIAVGDTLLEWAKTLERKDFTIPNLQKKLIQLGYLVTLSVLALIWTHVCSQLNQSYSEKLEKKQMTMDMYN